jgi:hypothetical protein
MLQRLRTIVLILNFQSLIVAALAVLSTYFCIRYDITANFPLTLLATAIVFPIVFSINSAYKRREVVLDDYASLKSHGRAIFFASRDWLEDADPDTAEKCRRLLGNLLTAARSLFSGQRADMHKREENVYQYRTPRTLRAFSDFFIKIMPPLYGPYFAYIAADFHSGLTYVMPVLFALVLVSLDNIQEHLENPFDQIGQDDVLINSEKFVDRLLAGAPKSSA